MKIPCEIVVWHILPLIRRELATELVDSYGMSQAEVARRFGVTDAAISQYITRKRGGEYSESRFYPAFHEEVAESARRMSEGSDFGCEMCRLCCSVKASGFLAEVYREKTGSYPPSCISDDAVDR